MSTYKFVIEELGPKTILITGDTKLFYGVFKEFRGTFVKYPLYGWVISNEKRKEVEDTIAQISEGKIAQQPFERHSQMARPSSKSAKKSGKKSKIANKDEDEDEDEDGDETEEDQLPPTGRRKRRSPKIKSTKKHHKVHKSSKKTSRKTSKKTSLTRTPHRKVHRKTSRKTRSQDEEDVAKNDSLNSPSKPETRVIQGTTAVVFRPKTPKVKSTKKHHKAHKTSKKTSKKTSRKTSKKTRSRSTSLKTHAVKKIHHKRRTSK